MKKFFKLLLNVSMLLLVSVAIIWVVIARPTSFTSGPYSHHPVNPDTLAEHTKILSEQLSPRNSENPDNLIEASSYIKKNLSHSSLDVSLQYFDVSGQSYANVIAKYGPDSKEVIVVGAHYDAYSDFPGADDNASGVAGLLELGKLIQTLKLKNRIELVAYSLEEPPFFATANMGSAVHATEFRQKNKKIKIMISLEMIGYFSDEDNSQNYPSKLLSLIYPNKGNFIAVVDQVLSNKAQGVKSAINQHTDLAAYSINAPAYIPGIDFSDHRNYWANDYPAVMVTDTSFYRNHMYHTLNDTYDRLDYEKMAKVVYGIFKYVQAIDSET